MRASHFGWLASLADLSLAAAAAYKRSASEPTRRLFNCNSVTQEVYQQLNRSSENHSFTGNFLILSVIIFLCLYGKMYNSVIHNIWYGNTVQGSIYHLSTCNAWGWGFRCMVQLIIFFVIYGFVYFKWPLNIWSILLPSVSLVINARQVFKFFVVWPTKLYIRKLHICNLCHESQIATRYIISILDLHGQHEITQTEIHSFV